MEIVSFVIGNRVLDMRVIFAVCTFAVIGFAILLIEPTVENHVFM